MWNKVSSCDELKNIEMKVVTINVNYISEDEESYSKTKILEPDEIRASVRRHVRIVRPPIRNKDYSAMSNASISRSQDSFAVETHIDRTRQ